MAENEYTITFTLLSQCYSYHFQKHNPLQIHNTHAIDITIISHKPCSKLLKASDKNLYFKHIYFIKRYEKKKGYISLHIVNKNMIYLTHSNFDLDILVSLCHKNHYCYRFCKRCVQLYEHT